MKILIGTTNHAKAKWFEELLKDRDVEILTLADLGITDEAEETGTAPEENAKIKALFYGRYFDTVVCNDSGLYFAELPTDDERQPGLHIRSPRGERLDDEGMIAYYAKLIHSLGGRVTAFYLDAFAVYRNGKVCSFSYPIEEAREKTSFYMTDTPSPLRHAGWPLDSISLHKDTLTSFVDDTVDETAKEKDTLIVGKQRRDLLAFLRQSLGLRNN